MSQAWGVSRPIRVVLVEDSQVFRETLELLFALRTELEIVASVSTGRDAVEACGRLRPDVVVVDYRMPGLNGAQTTEAVLGASPDSRIVCLTASVSQSERREILAAGAYACVMKDDDLDAIVAAINDAASHAPLA
jgi:DNA-binding NarL/FixJ family response regulator